jgi:hypothetical protein
MERKHQARNKARRKQFDFRIFRPGVVDFMRAACHRLEAVQEVKEVYTNRDIEGLGKNFLREACRQPAIAAYRFFIRYYALLALKERVQCVLREGLENENGVSLERLLDTPSSDAGWEHPRRILWEELGITDPVLGLRQLPEMLDSVARAVESSKVRDDERGARIVDDYALVHPQAKDDPFVRQTWEEARRLQQGIELLVNRLEPGGAGCFTLVEKHSMIDEVPAAS